MVLPLEILKNMSISPYLKYRNSFEEPIVFISQSPPLSTLDPAAVHGEAHALTRTIFTAHNQGCSARKIKVLSGIEQILGVPLP
jgi:hypothetical protein